jgi:hypothetical protein
MAGLGEQVQQGPIARVGSNPGPGGLKLAGYRGVDARHCVITAYGEGEATVAPVGTNQVRMAPHPHVQWKDIDPIGGPEYLSKGCAIHLGPVGRGCTLQFAECRRLGVWTQGRIGSEFASVGSVQVSAPVLQQARQAQSSAGRARKIAVATLPVWFLGCLFLMTGAVVALVLGLAGIQQVDKKRLGPEIPGEDYYEYVTIGDREMDEEALEGLKEPFKQFVTKPSQEHAVEVGAVSMGRVSEPDEWDDRFFEYVATSFEKHLKAHVFFRSMDAVAGNYATVLTELRQAGLPEVLAAIPYVESRYQPNLQSILCAKGYWQFMPELAHRLHVKDGIELVVADCTVKKSDGSSIVWNPTAFSPPAGLSKRGGPYVNIDAAGEPVCAIPVANGCKVDDRTDLVKSTRAAVYSLREAWDDPQLAQSGAGVAITIASHNAGYDDGRYGKKKSSNLKHAYARWAKVQAANDVHKFYGQNIRCETAHEPSYCKSVLPSETQHYVYSAVAYHLLAVCYYGLNYRDQYEAFQSWDSMLGADGYCAQFNFPVKDNL